jgi:hypothetical protein
MRLLATIGALLLVLVSSAGATESTIYPGVGIGKIKLGMTPKQVERALGRDHILNASKGAYTEWAWNFATWTAGFEHGHVVQVTTSVRAQKTSTRVGPGTFWLKLMRAYPHGVCAFPLEGRWGAGPEYLVPHKGGTQTIFYLHQWPIDAGRYGAQPLQTYYVDSVRVRTPYEQLPEFSPTAFGRCKDGWGSTALPVPGG